MGISVKNKQVKIENEHNKGISFVLQKRILYMKKQKTFYFFKKTKLDTSNKEDKDGNPLIYALKGTYSYNIDFENKSLFIQNLNLSIKHYISFFEDFDCIVLAPTSNPILKEMVDEINKIINIDVYDDVFRKRLNNEIDIKLIKNKKIKKDIKANPNKVFKMKLVNPWERENINPLILKNKEYNYLKNKKILVIDDTVTTGTTLNFSLVELNNIGIHDISKFCFFGN